MGFEIKLPLGRVGGVKQNNIQKRVAFTSSPMPDSFRGTSVNKYMTEESIRYAIASNPEIKNILKEINAPLKLNMEELKELSENHAKDTQNVAQGIINNLPKGLKERVNVKSVKDAAILHDIGKVLIPSEVLNKNGKLNDKEIVVMRKHSELGYELLKNTDIDTRTLHLIKYHHQNASQSGYPKVPKDFWADINLQILSAADKYSALTEKRVYKEPLSSEKALQILYRDVIDGNLHPFVFKSLKQFAEGSTVNNPVSVL